MRLRTLGRLELGDSGFGQQQAMLLLAFLAIEGPKERTHLAELFWSGAKQPLNNLSSAISRVRAVDGSLIEAGRHVVATTVEVDAQLMATLIASGRLDQALELYDGRFLNGIDLTALDGELQEWILDQREMLATSVRDVAIRLAVQHSNRGEPWEAARFAQQALTIGIDAIPDPGQLCVLHPLLAAVGSPLAVRVSDEAAELGVDLSVPAVVDALSSPTGAETGARRRSSGFFGREGELVEVQRVLESGRPVVISGLGGVGKSRLAREVLLEREALRGAGHWVDLGTVHSFDNVADAIRAVVVPAGEPVHDIDELADTIGDGAGVLVLDNMEHLATDAGRLGPLVTRCRALNLVMTSRTVFSLPGAQLLPLAGLPVDSPDGGEPGPAVLLFLASVQRHLPSFGSSDEDVEAAIEVGRLLHGHPLALELVAGWSTVLSPPEIAAELGRDLDLVSAPDRSTSRRGYRELMERSWQLLDATTRDVMNRLSVFPAGFDRRAAAAVAGADLGHLRALAEHSLVARSPEGLFRCHPLVLDHAAGRLVAEPAVEAETRAAHAAFLVGAFGQPPDSDPARIMEVAAVEDEAENLLRAWRWCAGSSPLADELLIGLADPLSRVLGSAGRHTEALDALESVFQRDADGEVSRLLAATLRMQQVWLYVVLGRNDEARHLADRSLDGDLGDLGDQPELVVELNRARATVDRHEGEVVIALDRLTALGGIVHRVPTRMQSLVADDIAHCQLVLGDIDAAISVFSTSLALARAGRSSFDEVRTLLSLATALLDDGRPTEARLRLLDATAVADRHGLDVFLPYLGSKLAIANLDLGDLQASRRALAAVRQRSELAAERWLLIEVDLTSARLAAEEGRFGDMIKHLRDAVTAAVECHDLPYLLNGYVWTVQLTRGLREPDDAELRLLSMAAAHDATDHVDRRRATILLGRVDEAGRSGEDDPLTMVSLALDLLDRADQHHRLCQV